MTGRIRQAGWLVGVGLAAAFVTLTGTAPGAAGIDDIAGDTGSAAPPEAPTPTAPTTVTDDQVSSTPGQTSTTTSGATTDPTATPPPGGQGADPRGTPTTGHPGDGLADAIEPGPAADRGRPGAHPAEGTAAVPSVGHVGHVGHVAHGANIGYVAEPSAGPVATAGTSRAAVTTSSVPERTTAEVTAESTAAPAAADPAGLPTASAQAVALHRGAGQRLSFLVGLDQGVLLAGIALTLAASVGAGALLGRSRRGWAHRLPRPPARL